MYVLGLHLSSRGFGWIVFEAPDSVLDWGTPDIRRGNSQAIKRVGRLLSKYEPGVLAVEGFDGAFSRRRPRVRDLYRQVIREAERRHIIVRIYSREQIGHVFGGERTRDGIAARIAENLKPLRPRLPKPRKIWNSERGNMALFSAAACALVYYVRDCG